MLELEHSGSGAQISLTLRESGDRRIFPYIILSAIYRLRIRSAYSAAFTAVTAPAAVKAAAVVLGWP